jgi:acylphosphatase
MTSKAASEARRVFYCGHVQGVGFRYTARRIAQGYAVTGFVRNLADGRVELLAEGSPDEIDRLLAEIAQRMSGYVRSAEVHTVTPAGRYGSFEIATDQ